LLAFSGSHDCGMPGKSLEYRGVSQTTLFISQTTLFHTFTMAERPCDWRCWTAGLFLETAMLATDARRCPPRSRGLLGGKLTRRAAGQMAAARKSFRGGRPLQPTLCPRCGTPAPARSRPQPTAWGRLWGIARRNGRTGPNVPLRLEAGFPRWKYHATRAGRHRRESSGGSRPR